MTKQEANGEARTVTTMRSMRTMLLKPYDENKAVTEASNPFKLSLQESRGGTNQKPLTSQAISLNSQPSTNSCQGKLTVQTRVRGRRR